MHKYANFDTNRASIQQFALLNMDMDGEHIIFSFSDTRRFFVPRDNILAFIKVLQRLFFAKLQWSYVHIWGRSKFSKQTAIKMYLFII